MTSYFLTGMRPSSEESQGGRARPAWRYETGTQPSLPDVHASVPVDARANWLRRLLAFSGPGYMVAVGYMDPGNWATDIAGGVHHQRLAVDARQHHHFRVAFSPAD
jgi:manganese transport protein